MVAGEIVYVGGQESPSMADRNREIGTGVQVKPSKAYPQALKVSSNLPKESARDQASKHTSLWGDISYSNPGKHFMSVASNI